MCTVVTTSVTDRKYSQRNISCNPPLDNYRDKFQTHQLLIHYRSLPALANDRTTDHRLKFSGNYFWWFWLVSYQGVLFWENWFGNDIGGNVVFFGGNRLVFSLARISFFFSIFPSFPLIFGARDKKSLLFVFFLFPSQNKERKDREWYPPNWGYSKWSTAAAKLPCTSTPSKRQLDVRHPLEGLKR